MAYGVGPNLVRDGLVMYLDAANPKSYPGSGTQWNDLTGGGNNGTLVNGPTFDSGNAGSIQFDGVNDYIQISETTFDYSSISGWIKTTTTSSEQNIISGFMIAEGTIRGNIGIQSGYLVWTRGTPRRYTLMQVNDGDWHHFHLNKNSITDFNMYIDGELSNFDSTVSNVRLSERVAIGCRFISGAPSLFFDGNISKLSVYNRVLEEGEIIQNFNSSRGRFGS
jgi:hypothetical protein